MNRQFEILLPNRRKHAHKIIGYINSNDCWMCTTLSKDRDGYVKIHVNGKDTRLHRAVYEVFFSKVPDNLVVRHKCDNPGCCNPEHLEIGTRKDNAMDRKLRGRDSKVRKRLTKKQFKYIKDHMGFSIPRLAKELNVSHTTIVKAKGKIRAKKNLGRVQSRPSIHETKNKRGKKKDKSE